MGNTRVSFKDSSGVLVKTAESHFDPWGLRLTGIGSMNGFPNRFELQGHEKESTFNLNRVNLVARTYNPTTGRMDRVDALAEKYLSYSPFSYSLNNPILFIGPDGNKVVWSDGYSSVSVDDGDIYDSNGNYLKNDGIDDKKVYVVDAQKLDTKTKGWTKWFVKDQVEIPNLTNEELNTKATLNTIRESEGHGTPTEYDTQYGGGKIENLDQHPNEAITKWGKTSTAAGAYQFLAGTWKAHAAKLGLTDFSPESQDKAATYEISLVKGAKEMVETGQYNTALKMLSGKWTSLPGGVHEWKPNLDKNFLKNRAAILNKTN